MKNLFMSVFASVCLLISFFTAAGAQDSSSLTIHDILVNPKPENVSYEISTYLSVLDSAGVPIQNLKAENFSIVEDSKQMVIESISLAKDPINLVIVLDTSGSMTGAAIKSAKDAANSFLLGLGNEDQVSILSFNNSVKSVIAFTKDRQAAGQQLALVDAIPSSGTCLYNAAYQAVQNVAALPPGRRAVLLLTDGVDETNTGEPCSTFTIDDVIHIASGGNSPVPIYTLGMGNRVDRQSLQRLAALTGGRFQFAPTADQLSTIFKNLSDQLKSQYLLTYSTTSAQGSHTLVIQATTPGGSAKDTRNFNSQEMPPGILIKSPKDGQSISGKQVISVEVTGHSDDVNKVVLYVGGNEVGQAAASPYNFEFEFTSNFTGNTSIEVVALGPNGDVLTRKSIKVNVVIPNPEVEVTPTISPSATPISTPTPPTPPPPPPPAWWIIGGVVLLVVVLIVALLLLFKKLKKKRSSASYILEVETSDDKTMIGKRFEIQQPITRIGRLIQDNDISFPNDPPVSKHHAILEIKGNELFITEDPQGTAYGTFVGGIKVKVSPVILRSGDKILLGKRLTLKVRSKYEDRTMDGVIEKGQDKTIDPQPPHKEPDDPFKTQYPE